MPNIEEPEKITLEAGERLDQLISAIVAIASSQDLETTLQEIVNTACKLIGAKYGALGVIGPDGTLKQFITVGINPDDKSLIDKWPQGTGLLGLIVKDPKPLRLTNLTSHPLAAGFPEGHPPMHSFLGLPIKVGNHVFGNLYLTEKASGTSFSEMDEWLALALAAVAGVSIENSQLTSSLRKTILLEERERIARELHDVVIQRLFTVGLSLQTLTSVLDNQDTIERIENSIESIDATITEIRTKIFDLSSHERKLSDSILTLVRTLQDALGFQPSVNFKGPVDKVVDKTLSSHILATLREALSNIACHAHASAATIELEVSDELVLRVSDNGVGMPPPPDANSTYPNATDCYGNRHGSTSLRFHSGLTNIAKRAELLGGSLDISTSDEKGCTLVWRIPQPQRFQ